MAASWTQNRKFWNLILEASCEAQRKEGDCSEIHQEAHDILTNFGQREGEFQFTQEKTELIPCWDSFVLHIQQEVTYPHSLGSSGSLATRKGHTSIFSALPETLRYNKCKGRVLPLCFSTGPKGWTPGQVYLFPAMDSRGSGNHANTEWQMWLQDDFRWVGGEAKNVMTAACWGHLSLGNQVLNLANRSESVHMKGKISRPTNPHLQADREVKGIKCNTTIISSCPPLSFTTPYLCSL